MTFISDLETNSPLWLADLLELGLHSVFDMI